jgi:hypothetical protein
MCMCQNSGKSCHCMSGKCSCGPKCACPHGDDKNKGGHGHPGGGHGGGRPHEGHKPK